MFGIMIIWDYSMDIGILSVWRLLASACLDSSLGEKFTQLNKKKTIFSVRHQEYKNWHVDKKINHPWA